MPALLTRMSIFPNCAIAAFTTDFTCSSSLTSSVNAAALPPAAVISWTNSFSFSGLRAATATVAPSLASLRAQVRPMPCEAPVTSATRPERDMRVLPIARWNDCRGTQNYTRRCAIRRGAGARSGLRGGAQNVTAETFLASEYRRLRRPCWFPTQLLRSAGARTGGGSHLDGSDHDAWCKGSSVRSASALGSLWRAAGLGRSGDNARGIPQARRDGETNTECFRRAPQRSSRRENTAGDRRSGRPRRLEGSLRQD